MFALIPLVQPATAQASLLGDIANILIGGATSSGTSSSSSSSQKSNRPNLAVLKTQEHAVVNPTSQDQLFILAVKSGDISTVEQCLQQGADINGVFNLGGAGITPLLVAGTREMQQYLLEKGADVRGYYTLLDSDNKTYFVSYFSAAVYHQNFELAKYYHGWGAPIHTEGWSNKNYGVRYYGSPIFAAFKGCYYNDLDNRNFIAFVQYLADEGADLETPFDNGTFYLYAVKHGKYGMIDCLVTNGARIDARDSQGRDALQIALDNNNLQLYKYIQEVNKRGQQPSKRK